MRRAKSPSAHEPPPKATAESDASDSAESRPTKGAADEPVSSRSDQQPEAAATTPTGSTSKHDVPSIRSGASRAGAGAANSPDDNGVAAANNEKPGSTRQNSASGSAEWSPDRRSTPASTTSNDGTAKRFAVKGALRYFISFLPYIGYHHVLMMLLGVVVITLPLVLAGCTSAGPMQAFRLVSISYATEAPSPKEAMLNATLGSSMLDLSMNETEGTPLVREVQVGYFSICVRLESEDWQCGINGAAVPGRPNISDALGVVDMGHLFRTKTVSPALFIIVILLCAATMIALSTFPGWHEEEDTEGSLREIKPFPSRAVSTLALLSSLLATAVAYVAALWQHTSCAATGTLFESLRYGAVEVHIGAGAAALGWISVFVCAVCGVGMIVMILSIRIVANL